MRAFRLAYDGRPFHGFQRQPDVPTVEDSVFNALRDLDVLGDGERAPPGYAAAGRTDAGVSASAQTIAFRAPDWLVPAALNSELPPEIRAWGWTNTNEEFHATHDASSREYAYHLYGPAIDDEKPSTAVEGGVARAIDDDAVAAVLDRLVGTHDFHNLTTDDGDTTRTIVDAAVERDGDFLVVTVRADGFLRHLVRRIVSLARAVGAGETPVDRVDRVLSPDPIDGPEGVPAAPAHPLVLTDVTYPSIAFDVDETAARSAREVFEARRIERRTRARVSAELLSGIDPNGES